MALGSKSTKASSPSVFHLLATSIWAFHTYTVGRINERLRGQGSKKGGLTYCVEWLDPLGPTVFVVHLVGIWLLLLQK